jgi:hypothetical protein
MLLFDLKEWKRSKGGGGSSLVESIDGAVVLFLVEDEEFRPPPTDFCFHDCKSFKRQSKNGTR